MAEKILAEKIVDEIQKAHANFSEGGGVGENSRQGTSGRGEMESDEEIIKNIYDRLKAEALTEATMTVEQELAEREEEIAKEEQKLREEIKPTEEALDEQPSIPEEKIVEENIANAKTPSTV